jgi:HSP20 family protein
MSALTTKRNNGTRTSLPGWSNIEKNLFEDFFPQSRANIVENEDNYEWLVDMPGVGAENIDVEVNERKGMVEVSTNYEESSENVKRRRSYSRAVGIGESIDAENIEASYEDGVLTVTLPKTKKEEVTRKIEVT